MVRAWAVVVFSPLLYTISKKEIKEFIRLNHAKYNDSMQNTMDLKSLEQPELHIIRSAEKTHGKGKNKEYVMYLCIFLYLFYALRHYIQVLTLCFLL